MADEESSIIKVVVKTTNTKETIEIELNATIREVVVVFGFHSKANTEESTLNLVYIFLVQREGFAEI